MTNQTDLCHEYALFSELNVEQMNAIKRICREECFYPDQTLFKEGEPALKMYILADGELSVYYSIGEGGLVQVDRVWRDAIFGCSALVPPYKYTATVRPKTRVEVLVLDAVALRELFNEEPRLAVVFQQQVIQCLLARITDLRFR